jgi:uncharacterized protein
LAVRIALLCFFAGWVFSGSVLALDVPPLTGRIVDAARVLPPDLTESLTQELAGHERRTGNQVAVLTLPGLQGELLEEFSHRVATTWKLGQKGTDNGVLLLVSPQDRQVRIEVGYGLEGVLTDAATSRIIRNEMVPHFRKGEYAQGIAAGVKAIMATIEGTYSAAPNTHDRRAAPWSGGSIGIIPAILAGAFVGAILLGLKKVSGLFGGGVIAFLLTLSAGLFTAVIAAILALILGLVLSLLFRGGGIPGGGYSGTGLFGRGGGGFSGGDSFLGGGGGFGGGGASGRW